MCIIQNTYCILQYIRIYHSHNNMPDLQKSAKKLGHVRKVIVSSLLLRRLPQTSKKSKPSKHQKGREEQLAVHHCTCPPKHKAKPLSSIRLLDEAFNLPEGKILGRTVLDGKVAPAENQMEQWSLLRAELNQENSNS